MGESDFVQEILAEANEKYNRYYELKSLGYDLKSTEQEVGEIYQIEPEDIFQRPGEDSSGSQKFVLLLGGSRVRIRIDGFG